MMIPSGRDRRADIIADKGVHVFDTDDTVVRVITGEQMQANAVRLLGLDPDTLDLGAPEALAALVRRAASFATPCVPRTLREVVICGLNGLSSTENTGDARDQVDAMIEALVGYGDLLELATQDEGVEGTFLYLSPPIFVWREAGVAFLLGGLPDAVEMLPAQLLERVQYASHTRRLYAKPGEDLRARLLGFGLIDLPERLWFAPPRPDSAAITLARAGRALERLPSHGAVPGLVLLDPARPVSYYNGRWVEPSDQTGRFVARREQRFGANLWSYVEMAEGHVVKLLDLSRIGAGSAAWRGCDAAWYLQMAIDAMAGHSQCYRCRSSAPVGSVIVDFFSPIPQWARRRWDVLGERISPVSSLFAYRFPAVEFADERRFLHDELWLTEMT